MGGYLNLTGKFLIGALGVYAAGKVAERLTRDDEKPSTAAADVQAMLENLTKYQYESLECATAEGRKFWEGLCDKYNVTQNKILREALWQTMNEK